MEDLLIDDITLDDAQSRVTISGVPDQPGLAAQVFEEVAAAGIVVDMIVQSVGREGRAAMSFTMPESDFPKGVEVAGRLTRRLGCPAPTSCPKVAKLSVLGTGMKSQTSLSKRLFQSLASAGVNVEMINTSEVRLNVVVEGAAGQKAVELLRKEFADVIV